MHRWIVAACTMLFFAGSAGSRAAEQHVFRWADGLDVSTLNPLLATSGNVTSLAAFTMAHFVRFGPHDELVPELITAIPTTQNGGISRDGRSITYHLRRGVRWSDGAPFDARDVEYTARVIQNPKNNITQRAAWDHVASVTVRDLYTVVFRLKTPYAPFASEFFSTFSTSCVLPKHVLASRVDINDAPYNALPVGIGPFRYTAFRRGEAVEMEANPYYFRGLPKLRKIVYKIATDDNTIYTQLQTGELDLWSEVSGNFVERLRGVATLKTASAVSPYMAGVYLNTTRPAVRDPRVRRALRLATDRAAILRDASHGAGTLAESVVPRVTADFDAGIAQAPFDPAAAEKLLDAAGWKRGAGGLRARAGIPLTVEIALPSGYVPSVSTAELLRATWGKLGIDVEVKSYAAGQFFGPLSAGGILSSGKFDAALLSIPGSVLADESAFYGCAYAPPNGFNETRYCNHRVDADMNAYAASYDPIRRAALARRFQRQIDDDAPAIVTYERSFVYAFNARLTGFTPNSFGPFDDFLNVDAGS